MTRAEAIEDFRCGLADGSIPPGKLWLKLHRTTADLRVIAAILRDCNFPVGGEP